MRLKIPPPVYGLMAALLMWLLDRVIPVVPIFSSPTNRFAYVLIFIALMIESISLVDFVRHQTTINPMHPENSQTLVITSSYRFSRNPMYLGLLLLLFAWAILLGSLSAFFILPLFVVVITMQQIIPEEKCLEKKFGDHYLAYKKSVRRWF